MDWKDAKELISEKLVQAFKEADEIEQITEKYGMDCEICKYEKEKSEYHCRLCAYQYHHFLYGEEFEPSDGIQMDLNAIEEAKVLIKKHIVLFKKQIEEIEILQNEYHIDCEFCKYYSEKPSNNNWDYIGPHCDQCRLYDLNQFEPSDEKISQN